MDQEKARIREIIQGALEASTALTRIAAALRGLELSLMERNELRSYLNKAEEAIRSTRRQLGD